MKIENLNIAYKLLIDLNDIEEQKKEIHKSAEILVSNDDTDNDFSLSISIIKEITEVNQISEEDLTKKWLDQKHRFQQQSDAYIFLQNCNAKIENENENKIDLRISQKISLQILGLLISDLNEKEKIILQELKSIGVTYKNKRP